MWTQDIQLICKLKTKLRVVYLSHCTNHDISLLFSHRTRVCMYTSKHNCQCPNYGTHGITSIDVTYTILVPLQVEIVHYQ